MENPLPTGHMTQNVNAILSQAAPTLQFMTNSSGYDGCRRCSQFYIGHCTPNCDGTFPDAATYLTLTQADAVAQGGARGKTVKVKCETAAAGQTCSTARTACSKSFFHFDQKVALCHSLECQWHYWRSRASCQRSQIVS